MEANRDNVETKITYTKVASPNAGLFITCSQVYKQISDANVLFIDCRPDDRFNESKISCKNLINISEDCIKKG